MKTSIYPAGIKHTGERVGKGLVGKKSGLNKRAFYILMLKGNEKEKLPDAELQKIFDAEFPDTVHYKVAGIRAAVNRGAFGEVGFQSNPHDEPTPGKKPRAKKAVQTISLPDMSSEPEPAPPAKKVRLRRGKES